MSRPLSVFPEMDLYRDRLLEAVRDIRESRRKLSESSRRLGELVLEMREKGATLREIAEVLDVTPPRVSAIVSKAKAIQKRLVGDDDSVFVIDMDVDLLHEPM